MRNNYRKSERGGAGIKLLVFMIVLISVIHAGYNYIPVAYQGQSFKQEMQTAVINGASMPTINGKTPVDIVKEKVTAAARNYQIPPGAVIQVKQLNSTVQARVAYSKRVPILPFGLYTRTYEFDYTATPGGFLAGN